MAKVELTIDEGFKNLIRPLSPEEYIQLETNIIRDGCREPITIWGNTIVDGHNRYEICCKHDIPFSVTTKEFKSRDEVIVWICANQLGRRNISDETRRYLIGKKYESEKVIDAPNPNGNNQYAIEDDIYPSPSDWAGHHKTANKVAAEYHISHGTVQKYSVYSRALDIIGKADPSLVPRILSGSIKISHENVVALSRLSADEIRMFGEKMGQKNQSFTKFSGAREDLPVRVRRSEPIPLPANSVKNMPKYDPDAEITGLALTIPSWVSSIDRAKETADFSSTSKPAKTKLVGALKDLLNIIMDLLTKIEEED